MRNCLKLFHIVSLLVLVTFFSMIPVVYAQVDYFDIDVDIDEKDVSRVNMIFTLSKDVNNIRFSILGKVSNLEVGGGSCNITGKLETVFDCIYTDNGNRKIKISFETTDFVKKSDKMSIFNFEIPIISDINSSSILVKLPLGMGIKEDVEMPYTPLSGETLVIKNRITVYWVFDNRKQGDTVSIRIFYEPILPFSSTNTWVVVFVGIILLTAIYVAYKLVLRRSRKIVFSVLDENEKKIMNIITKQGGKSVNQRKIVRLSDFSKAKVSRVIRALQERGVVEVERIGRTNRVNLKKRFFKR